MFNSLSYILSTHKKRNNRVPVVHSFNRGPIEFNNNVTLATKSVGYL